MIVSSFKQVLVMFLGISFATWVHGMFIDKCDERREFTKHKKYMALYFLGAMACHVMFKVGGFEKMSSFLLMSSAIFTGSTLHRMLDVNKKHLKIVMPFRKMYFTR